MKLLFIAVACSLLFSTACTPPTRGIDAGQQSVVAALEGIPDDRDIAYVTSGGLQVADYSMFGNELMERVRNLPEAKQAVILESLIDLNALVKTTYIIRTFRELKLQMSEDILQKLTNFVRGIEKFSRDEALANEVFLYKRQKKAQ